MNAYDIEREYYDWICSIAMSDNYVRSSYSKLLNGLWSTIFQCILPLDRNRVSDGVNMRCAFAESIGININDYSDRIATELRNLYYYKPCSVLEMMVALAVRAEDQIMQDSKIGDRVSFWFMEMIKTLGLESMTDSRFDQSYFDECMDIFLHRQYLYNGDGGLFRVDNPKRDMRDTDIWIQCMWYLDEFLKKERYWEELTR